MRLDLKLSDQSDWIKIFDPRDFTVFVETDEAIDSGTDVHVDLDAVGWRVSLSGTVVALRDQPPGVVVAIAANDREKLKVNYVNGFVRGGLINHREKRRLPLKLPVTYGAVEGPANTYTKDINEDGLFLFTDNPLPETSRIHMLISVPGRAQPLSIVGKVSHTISEPDDEPPGMGVVFDIDDAQRAQIAGVLRELEAKLAAD